MRSYYLLNRNKRLLEFHIENGMTRQIAVLDRSFCDFRPYGFADIDSWLENRNYAKHKEHFAKWLDDWGINTLSGFVEITHCLGLNDTLWVKRYDSNLTWEDVNLYRNDFSDVAQHTAFESGLYGLELSTTSPEFVTDGSFPKCWIRESDGIFLYKAGASGASNLGLEPFAEYLSSQISKQVFGDSWLRYDLVMYKGRLCTKCRAFTDEKNGFISFSRFSNAGNTSMDMDRVFQVCRDMDYENLFRRMIIMDAIVMNEDRHLSNFGFIVDNETNEIKNFAPIFDYNISLLCRATDDDLRNIDGYFKEFNPKHRLGGDFVSTAQAFLTPEIRKELPPQINLPRHPKFNMSEERLSLLNDIIQRNYNKLLGRTMVLQKAKGR